MHKAYIGIGSNLGNPSHQIAQAIEALRLLSEGRKITCSAIYISSPMTKDKNKAVNKCSENNNHQKNSTTNPKVVDKKQSDYLNAVVTIRTSMSAINLLAALQKIEKSQGRERNNERWAARTLDLDILLFDNEIINEPLLTVPHYGLKQRNFVIYPLADLNANLILPDGTTIKELHKSCSSEGIRKID